MRQVIFFFMSLSLVGCANQQFSGQGEYFELKNVHVLESDLSAFKPTQVVNRPDNTMVSPAAFKNDAKEKNMENGKVYYVRLGERYQTAITRWLNSLGYKNIAWSMGRSRIDVLDSVSSTSLQFDGDIDLAIKNLSSNLGFPIRLNLNEKLKVAGVYDFDGVAQITHIQGDTIKQVTKEVALGYGFKWDDSSGLARSWIPNKDYKFGADYYLLTAKHDILSALNIVLEEYPFYARIVESTGQVIIQEEL